MFTGDVDSAGTNANVFLTVYGDKGDTGERQLKKSETHLDKFERNNVSRFYSFLNLNDSVLHKTACCVLMCRNS